MGVAWCLLGWVMGQTDELLLVVRLVGESGLISRVGFDPVLAALTVAVLEEAYQLDSVPREVTPAGAAVQLGKLFRLREFEPFFDREDLRTLLLNASEPALEEFAELAQAVLAAHACGSTGRCAQRTACRTAPEYPAPRCCPAGMGAARATTPSPSWDPHGR